MHYIVDITIDLPRDKVVALFADPGNMPKWQEGLLSAEPLDGTPGQPGSRTKLVFQMGNRQVERIETITLRELPHTFEGTYETDGVFNVVKNRFHEISPEQTRWESENEFRFTSMFMKLMGVAMKGAFPKQSQKYLADFKAFAETGADVREKQQK